MEGSTGQSPAERSLKCVSYTELFGSRFFGFQTHQGRPIGWYFYAFLGGSLLDGGTLGKLVHMIAVEFPLGEQAIAVNSDPRLVGRGIIRAVEVRRISTHHHPQPVEVEMRIPSLHWIPCPFYESTLFRQSQGPLGPLQARADSLVLEIAGNGHHVGIAGDLAVTNSDEMMDKANHAPTRERS